MKPLKVAGRRSNIRTEKKPQRPAGVSAALLYLVRTKIVPLCTDYLGPFAALAVLVAACFTLPIHRSPYSRDSSLPSTAQYAQPADYAVHMAMPLAREGGHISFTIPAIRKHSSAYSLLFWFAVNALLLGLVSWYWIRNFRNDEDRKHKRLLLRLIFSISAFAGLMIASVIAGSDLGGEVVAATLGTAGVIAAALLTATVLGRSASTLTVALLAAVMGLMDIFPAWATVAALAGALAGQYPARSVRNRAAVVRCAAFVMLACAASGFIAGLVSGLPIGSAGSLAMQALLTGCLGAALWFTLLTIMERPFELTTPLGLLELLDPTRPILERFAREAPGTFAHSLMVGHLAASAAESVNADPLLCRVAAQYHDIGKMERAQFFRENQQEENIHDHMAPSLSALVVNSHVRDGERMAKELGLPPVISDIITQHHGTTLMQYFYYRASAGAEPSVADALQHQFRYSGPKPQSKEAAIMMLADAIEAASRTLLKPSQESVRCLVDSVFDSRIRDNQLDESPLTLKDIKVIREKFVAVVCAMMHQRVEYPGAISQGAKELVRLDTIDIYEDFDPTVTSNLETFGPENLRSDGFIDPPDLAQHRPVFSRPPKRRAQRPTNR